MAILCYSTFTWNPLLDMTFTRAALAHCTARLGGGVCVYELGSLSLRIRYRTGWYLVSMGTVAVSSTHHDLPMLYARTCQATKLSQT